jgi:predicted kinase
MLIIVCGLPGSGKSTLAKSLADKVSVDYISSDIVRKRMFEKPSYTEEEKEEVYAEMARQASASVSAGRHALVDATFYLKRERERFRSIARENGTEAHVILCTLDQGKVERRMNERKMGGPSDADFKVYLKMKDRFEPIDGPHLEIDTSLPKREIAARVMAFLGL